MARIDFHYFPLNIFQNETIYTQVVPNRRLRQREHVFSPQTHQSPIFTRPQRKIIKFLSHHQPTPKTTLQSTTQS